MSHLSKAMNVLPSAVLRSPLHPLMSSTYALIEFTGRRTGHLYSTPVAYLQDAHDVLISTDSAWWKNFRGGAAVGMVLRGRRVRGTAHPVMDPVESVSVLRRLVDEIPSYAKPAGLTRVQGRVCDAEIARALAQGRVCVRIALDGELT